MNLAGPVTGSNSKPPQHPAGVAVFARRVERDQPHDCAADLCAEYRGEPRRSEPRRRDYFSAQLQAFHYVARPNAGPGWEVRFQLQFLFPK